jgi:phosphonate utilization associated putative membrane protein
MEISPLVTALVLGSALLHAGWNAVIKSSRDVMLDTALVAAGAGLLALPLIAAARWPASESWPYLGVSAAIHVAYFSTLVAAYRLGDLSHAYPLMRGTAPLLVAVFGVALLDEHPGPTMWLGIALISAGILSLGLLQRGRVHRGATLWAFANAAIIASYTIVDGTGARLSGTPPGYVAWLLLLQGLLFVPLIAMRRGQTALQYARRHWLRGLAGGFCLIGAYGIVLWAMTMAPIAAVAALRETSVIFATLLGSIFLKERFGWQRLLAAVAVALGIAALRS